MKRILKGAVIAAPAFLACAGPAAAQHGLIDLVPAAEFRDARGVDMVGAVYRHHEPLLSIGGGGGSRSLDVVLTLVSPGSQDTAPAMILRGLNVTAYLANTRFGTAETTAVLPHQSGKFWIVTSGVYPIDDYYVTGAFSGSNFSASNFEYIGADGTEATFSYQYTLGVRRAEQIRFPDGETWTYRYHTTSHSCCAGLSRLRSIVSNRGYGLQFDYAPDPPYATPGERALNFVRLARITAYNKAFVYCDETLLESCASVTALNSAATFSIATHSATITKPNGETVEFGFTEGSGLNLTSVTRPGGTRTMTYEEWSEQEGPTYRYITSLTEAGRTWQYGYGFISTPSDGNRAISVTEPGGATSTYDSGGTYVYRSVDALSRETLYGYSGNTRFHSRVYPEGNQVTADYDSRGNRTVVRQVPKPGSGLPTLQATATYPSSCSATDRRSCNQPTSTTDFNGNATDYTYDPAHGGVLTVTGPAVNGVRPQTRHTYAQRYAWVSNGSGGHVQAATPVWVRTATSTCRTSAATGNPASPCATAGDEVLTQYDYGPNSGPNTLVLRGQAVTATDGGVATTLRTCYEYDLQGRRISETQPNANLASCP